LLDRRLGFRVRLVTMQVRRGRRDGVTVIRRICDLAERHMGMIVPALVAHDFIAASICATS